MTDPSTAVRQLDLIATLITQALDAVETESPPRASEWEIHATAALHTITSLERDIRTDPAAAVVATNPSVADSAVPGAALLAAAERELIGLPPYLRNHLSVCAAAAHLRRARRAVVTS